jgi:site-specific DNA-methyltransferase (adenine-specific)
MNHPDYEIKPFFSSENSVIFNNDCLEVLAGIREDSIDMIFADPPYMLSNNGFTCKNGRMASVNKGEWDKSKGFEEDFKFHDTWITACRQYYIGIEIDGKYCEITKDKLLSLEKN